MADVARLVDAAAAGDRYAAAELLPLVYDELRALATVRLASEPAGQTLQPTALVHEAYLRLVGRADDARWENRGHFFAAAAEAMRRILVEAARRRGRIKRGGDLRRVSLGDLPLSQEQPDVDLVALDGALAGLAAESPAKARLVELRYFTGLTLDEAARALGISPATADRHWAYAKAWLYERLGTAGTGGE